MLRRLAFSVALFGAVTSAAASDVEPKYTPEQDLRCAAVIIIVASGPNSDSEAKTGLGFGLGYFLGRWEGVTENRFEDHLTPTYLEDTRANITKYSKECGERMMTFGGRMQVYGKKLQELGRNTK